MGWVQKQRKQSQTKLCIVGTLVYYHDDALFVEKHPYKAWPIMLAGWCIVKTESNADKEVADFIPQPDTNTLLKFMMANSLNDLIHWGS